MAERARRTALEAGIVTDDVEGLAAFYRSAFGFETVADLQFPQGTVLRMRAGDAALKLFAPTGGSVPRPVLDTWSSQRGFAYAALHVDDADATVDRAAAAGARVLVPVTAHRPGARFALLADPQGNVWEVLEEADQP